MTENNSVNLTINSKVKLNNGYEMPLFGLGVYQSKTGDETKNAVLYALEAGYRHIDTARIYFNEKEVGDAIKSSGVPREEIFITTKLWNAAQGYKTALKAFDDSLERLGTNYIDLYLVHFPLPGLIRETWRAMEEIYKSGKCRAIGVSNYTIDQLKYLMNTCNIKPAVNQVEFSPFLYQKKLLEFCRENGIQVEAYSPLTRGKKLNDKVLLEMAAKYGKTTSQILIRWFLEHEIVVIPKSVKKHRIIENASIFDFVISPEDMAILDNLNEDLHTGLKPGSPLYYAFVMPMQFYATIKNMFA
jgi:diketogulonate reductase-like aldo/keto reductase